MKRHQPSSGELLSTNEKIRTNQKLDKRKILLFLPIIVIVLAALAFYLTGGMAETPETEVAPKGINVSLPDAQFKTEQPTDKMGIYGLTEGDTAGDDGLEALSGRLGFPAEDPQTKKINEKLAAINREINSPVVPVKSVEETRGYGQPTSTAPLSKDVAKLESLMKHMQSGPEEDPEMRQLNALMDKIMAVQNPELAKQSQNRPSELGADSLFAALPAEIATGQKVRQGSVVGLRLLDTIVLNGVAIPKGHTLFGLASFSNQRLNLEIKNVRLGNQVIPVNLTVYDKRDAMVGIYAPEALLTDAVNGGIADASGSFGISGYDLTTQIAGAGIDAARSLLTKKIRRVKQNLKAGYPLLLRDNTKKAK